MLWVHSGHHSTTQSLAGINISPTSKLIRPGCGCGAACWPFLPGLSICRTLEPRKLPERSTFKSLCGWQGHICRHYYQSEQSEGLRACAQLPQPSDRSLHPTLKTCPPSDEICPTPFQSCLRGLARFPLCPPAQRHISIVQSWLSGHVEEAPVLSARE